jgi:hypothetical protein
MSRNSSNNRYTIGSTWGSGWKSDWDDQADTSQQSITFEQATQGEPRNRWGIRHADWARLDAKEQEKWDKRFYRSRKKRGRGKRFEKWIKRKKDDILGDVGYTYPKSIGSAAVAESEERSDARFGDLEQRYTELTNQYKLLQNSLGLGEHQQGAGGQLAWSTQAQQQQNAFNEQMAALQQQYQQQAADYQQQIQAFNVAQQQSAFANQMQLRTPTAVAPNTTASNAYNSRWFSRPAQQAQAQPVAAPTSLVDQSTNV